MATDSTDPGDREELAHTPGPWSATACGGHTYRITGKSARYTIAEINGPYTPGYDRYEGDARLIAAMAAHPGLIQRPIVARGRKAVIARPVERAAELLD